MGNPHVKPHDTRAHKRGAAREWQRRGGHGRLDRPYHERPPSPNKAPDVHERPYSISRPLTAPTIPGAGASASPPRRLLTHMKQNQSIYWLNNGATNPDTVFLF